MKLKIEAETKYKNGELVTRYWVWSDSNILEGFNSKDEAMALVDKIKSNSTKLGSVTIFEEEI